MKFYTSKYDYITSWDYKDGENIPEDIIAAGTVMKVLAMDQMGLVLQPINKSIKVVGGTMTFTPEMLKYGFTESDYIDG